jgi:hypothetical protein
MVVMTIGFFSWGLSAPPLDELWRLGVELEMGERGPLVRRERALVERSLQRHPQLAQNWLDGAATGFISRHHAGLVEIGYAYLVRSKSGHAILEVSLAPRQEGPVKVQARSGDATAQGELVPERPWSWRLPATGAYPELVEVIVQRDSKRPPLVVVRLAEAR